MKTYFTIYFKGRDIDPVSIPDHVLDRMRPDIMAKNDILLEYGATTFNPKDIRYIKREVQPDRMPDHDVPEISEEHRQSNLQRLAFLRESVLDRRGRPVPDEEWVNPYPDTDPRGQMKRFELRSFNKEFFDVYFQADDAREYAAGIWLAYARSAKDPRAYDRDSIVRQVREKFSGVAV